MADFGASVLSSSVALLGLLVIMGLIYTIWSQINMKKKQKYFKELHTELKPGQEVLFAGGIYGTVKGIEGEKVRIKVRSGAVVDVSRYAIQEISNCRQQITKGSRSTWQNPTFFLPASITDWFMVRLPPSGTPLWAPTSSSSPTTTWRPTPCARTS